MIRDYLVLFCIGIFMAVMFFGTIHQKQRRIEIAEECNKRGGTVLVEGYHDHTGPAFVCLDLRSLMR